MNRRRTLVLVAVALVAIAATAGVARGGDVARSPKLMVLTADDLGHGAVVESQRYTTSGEIPASSGYSRTFTGVTLGRADVIYLQNILLIGKNPAAAAKLISSILLALSSKKGRDGLYQVSEREFASSSKMTIVSGAVTRAGKLQAGDSAVEVVFRFNTTDGSFQVGEIFVRVGGNLSIIYYAAGTPGVSLANARRLTLLAAAHMKEPGSTG